MAKNATSIATLKTQAKHLQRSLSEKLSQKISTSQSLELIAAQYGFENWDTLVGVLKKPPAAVATPTLADLPFSPSEIEVERGLRSIRYDVSDFDEEVMALLHKEADLREFLAQYPELFSEGLDTVVISGSGDGEDINFTIQELLGATYHELGGCGNWELTDGETFLRFVCGSPDSFWTHKPKATVPVVGIPQILKSAKGCELLLLSSKDGFEYDRYVIVPPSQDVEKVKNLIDEEIARLKAADAALTEDNLQDEYTELDLDAFVSSLNCKLVGSQYVCSDTWD